MNVRELIEVLNQHPDDTRVVVSGYEDLSPELISAIALVLNTNTNWYDGRQTGETELADEEQVNARIMSALALHRPHHLTEKPP